MNINLGKIKELFNKFPLPIQAMILIINVVLFFGVIGPSMISSKSTSAVWIGLIILGLDGYLIYLLSEKLRKEIIK